MSLPRMAYQDNTKKQYQTSLKGYNHTEGAGDGELWDMQNLMSDLYPVLSTRHKRYLIGHLEKPNGIFGGNALSWVDGTSFYYNGEIKGQVADSRKDFTQLGAYIIIMPDKKYYNYIEDSFGDIEALYQGTAGQIQFSNGTVYGEEAQGCDMVTTGEPFPFKAGDAVSISGCVTYEQNNRTPVIREIKEDGKRLTFYENTFAVSTDTPETGIIVVERKMPENIGFVFENSNRLWGCSDNEIFCTGLGNIFNWNDLSGLADSSWAVGVGHPGKFTGAMSFQGYPVFFKEDITLKVYGVKPADFQIISAQQLGVASGSPKCPAIAGDMAFILSRQGPVAYAGGFSTAIAKPFGGDKYINAVGGSDGRKYYLSMQNKETEKWSVFAYDTRYGLWHKEDNKEAIGFAYMQDLYMLDSSGDILMMSNAMYPPENAELEDDFSWFAEFGDFTDGSANKKAAVKIHPRLALAAGATADMYISYDSGEYMPVAHFEQTGKRSFYEAVIPTRADHYSIKFAGHGSCKIYSLTRELSPGSAI